MEHKETFLDGWPTSTEFRFFDMVVLLTLAMEVPEKSSLSKKEFVSLVYDLLDRNGDGKVDEQEFMEAVCILNFIGFAPSVNASQAHGVFEKTDLNKNKLISYEEFLNFADVYMQDGKLSRFSDK